MTELFRRILHMSAAGCVVIAVVLAARLLLRPAPKKWSYLLWSVAAFRLCCPMSVPAAFSVFRLTPLRAVTQTGHAAYVPSPVQPPAVVPVTPPSPVAPVTPAAPATPAASAADLLTAASWLWVAGMIVMIVYCAFSYVKMRRLVWGAVVVRDNVYETDRVRSPFILGLLRPRIYIPAGLRGDRLDCVLAHEGHHLRRGDHVIKTFAFALLTVHWFNPLVWLAFQLMGKDMEMSCDEKVLSTREGKNRDYSAALLSFAAPERFPTATPLCFGESGVRDRIKNALRWRRPKVWVTALAAALCVIVLAACGADPTESKEPEEPQAISQQTPQETAIRPLEATVDRDLPVQITDLGGGAFRLADAGSTPGLDLTVTLPADWADRYGVETDGKRLRIYSQASRDAMGFAGWLCCIHVEPGFYPLDYENFTWLEAPVRVLAATENYTVLLNGAGGQQYTKKTEDQWRDMWGRLGEVRATLSDWLAQNSWNETNWVEGTVTLYQRDMSPHDPAQARKITRITVCDPESSQAIEKIIKGRYGFPYGDNAEWVREADRIEVEILVNGHRSYLLADDGSGRGNFWPTYGALDNQALTAEETGLIYRILENGGTDR